MRFVHLIISALLMCSAFVSAQTLTGTLQTDTVLNASSSGHVDGELTIPDGITLTLEAGVTLFFNAGGRLIVERGGCLRALGTADSRILMTQAPGASGKWKGITFRETMTDNVLQFVDMEYADELNYIIAIRSSRVVIDGMTWPSTNKIVIELEHPSVLIKNCLFPNVSQVETIHGQTLRDDEYLILDGNTFGAPTGYNDVIDFSDADRPGPVLEVYNNTFLGGGDDGLDLDGCDAHIEGNVFMHFHSDNNNGTSNAIATGFRFGHNSEITVVRNVFYDNDHCILLKEDCHVIAENNTFVGSTDAAVNFSEWPIRTVDPGRGGSFKNNIFWNNVNVFGNQYAQPGKVDPVIEVQNCLIDDSLHGLGENNFYADPLFVDETSDFRLLSGSPATDAGSYGQDLGYDVNGGIVITEGPKMLLDAASAVEFDFAGPGLSGYRYVLNDPEQEWSEILPIYQTLSLKNLNPDTYTLYVQGQNSAGKWQSDPRYIESESWVVGTGVNTELLQPGDIVLRPNYPNPFNPTTMLKYRLPQKGHVRLEIFNTSGQLIASLADKEQEAGWHTVNWNADLMTSGTYLSRLIFADQLQIQKMILLK